MAIQNRFNTVMTPQNPFVMGYAPGSWSCPNVVVEVDSSNFKKTDEEKAEIKQYKKELGKTKNYKFVTLVHVRS